MEKFKKGDQAYTIEEGLIIPCTILKVADENRIKDFKKGDVSRKKLYKIAQVDPSTQEFMFGCEHLSSYPDKFAYVHFESGIEKWKQVDCIKKSAGEFINFIN